MVVVVVVVVVEVVTVGVLVVILVVVIGLVVVVKAEVDVVVAVEPLITLQLSETTPDTLSSIPAVLSPRHSNDVVLVTKYIPTQPDVCAHWLRHKHRNVDWLRPMREAEKPST